MLSRVVSSRERLFAKVTISENSGVRYFRLQPNEYDKAVTLLIDLRDLALRQGRVAAFQSALGVLRQDQAAEESLLRRLTKAKL
jgi:hypothetical protein